MRRSLDVVLSRLREWGVEQVSATPGTASTGFWRPGRATNPKFVQARHEEMAAFEAVGYAKFSGRVGVCAATSGPGAIHLLNGLYDAMLDHVPVVAIVGQTSRSAMGGSYQQEVDLVIAVQGRVPSVRADGDGARAVPEPDRPGHPGGDGHPAPTCIIIPSDVQELGVRAPGHAFKMVPSSLGIEWPTAVARRRPIRQAAEILNAGDEGGHPGRPGGAGRAAGGDRGGRTARCRGGQGVAGQGRARRRPAVRDRLDRTAGDPAVSYEMMMDCDTLLTVGSNFPYTQFMPELGQARAIQIDLDGSLIGMRYPYELNLVADAEVRPAGADPPAGAQGRPGRGGTRSSRTWRAGGRPWNARP